MKRSVTALEVHSDEPPPQVTSEIAWRLAMRLFRDHGRVEADESPPRCSWCHQPWPCSGRRLAELGLNEALA